MSMSLKKNLLIFFLWKRTFSQICLNLKTDTTRFLLANACRPLLHTPAPSATLSPTMYSLLLSRLSTRGNKSLRALLVIFFLTYTLQNPNCYCSILRASHDYALIISCNVTACSRLFRRINFPRSETSILYSFEKWKDWRLSLIHI